MTPFPRPLILSWDQLRFLPDHDLLPTFLTTPLIIQGVRLVTRSNAYVPNTATLSLKAVRLVESNPHRAYNPLYQHLLDHHLQTNASIPPAARQIPGYPGHWYLFATPTLQD